MAGTDIKFMQEAIEWAKGCNPKYDRIPKVGAIIAVDQKVVGRGRRGTGSEGDDEHAEEDALKQVGDERELPQATLYTTLEPCTEEVRTNELKCCTHQILRHQIKKVFVGILDPNPGVTGKGLWKLQDNNVEVELFPHDLAKQIRAINEAFILSQQTLGARIISPEKGDKLETYKTNGKHTIRFTCLNSPTINNHLLSSRYGLYWPQGGSFRHIEKKVWEIDAYFGAPGEHTLHIVTATPLGEEMLRYYWRVVNLNKDRRNRLKAKFPDAEKLLGGDYFGIEMTGLPKGLRSEASVTVTIAEKPPAASPQK